MIETVYALLSTYIHPLEEPSQWLPIAALVYSVFEWHCLIQTWKNGKILPRPLLWRLNSEKGLRQANDRRTISVILIGLLSGAYFVSLFVKS